MGGAGSGRKRKVQLTDTVKNLIKLARMYNIRWQDIANALGYVETDTLEKIRRENPEWDMELSLAHLTKKVSFAQKIERAAIPDHGGKVNTELAIKLAEQLGIFERENKGPPQVAINQLSTGGAPPMIQVAFIEPKQIAQEGETIDVTTD